MPNSTRTTNPSTPKLPLMSGGVDARRIKVSAEAIFEVTDPVAVERAALASIERSNLAGDERSAAEIITEEQEAVRGDLVEAISWLAEPMDMVRADVPGVQAVGAEHRVHDLGTGGGEGDTPDFANLFPVCGCGQESCDRCGGFQLTPRTAASLWVAGRLEADEAYEDVVQRGDEPVDADGDWMVFDEYPRSTWCQDAVWRRQAARAFDDLAGDIAAGEWPQPRCPGEEMALQLMLRFAEAAVDDDWAGFDEPLADLPTHADDFDWELAIEVLFRDGEHPPHAWFTAFGDLAPRDGRRPFRR
jgi:hypothetical protein